MAEHLSLLSRIGIDVLDEPMRLFRIVGDPQSDELADDDRASDRPSRSPAPSSTGTSCGQFEQGAHRRPSNRCDMTRARVP
jgi:hypothetical protein